DSGDLLVLLHLGRFPAPADLPEQPKPVHDLGGAADVRRPIIRDELGRDLRDVDAGAGAGLRRVHLLPALPDRRHRHEWPEELTLWALGVRCRVMGRTYVTHNLDD